MRKAAAFIFLLLIVKCNNAISQVNLVIEQQASDKLTIIDSEVSDNSFIDTRDNQKYIYVSIGQKKWMAENLNFRSPHSLTYNNTEKYGGVFGRLYNWEEAKYVCPENWRLPAEEDWKNLEAFIGLDSITIDSTGWRGGVYGDMLKSKKSKTWLSNVSSNLPNVGFDAIPAGLAYDSNQYANISMGGYFWSATNYYSSFAWSRYLSCDNGGIYRNISIISWHFSVRCIKD